MEQSAKEFYLKEVFPVSYKRNPSDIELWYETDGHAKQVTSIMIEFAKLHVKAALEAAQESTLEYDFTEEITNSYPLENIK
jgi:hypothetical protein